MIYHQENQHTRVEIPEGDGQKRPQRKCKEKRTKGKRRETPQEGGENKAEELKRETTK